MQKIPAQRARPCLCRSHRGELNRPILARSLQQEELKHGVFYHTWRIHSEEPHVSVMRGGRATRGVHIKRYKQSLIGVVQSCTIAVCLLHTMHTNDAASFRAIFVAA